MLAVESQRDYHRVRSTSTVTSVIPLKSDGTSSISLSHVPAETESYSHEGVLIGTDVLSTTLGNPIPIAIDSRSEVTVDKFTTVSSSSSRTPSFRQSYQGPDLSNPEIILYNPTTPAQNQGPPLSDEFTTLQSTTTKLSTSTTPPHSKFYIVPMQEHVDTNLRNSFSARILHSTTTQSKPTANPGRNVQTSKFSLTLRIFP